jgi:hypothetical protein
MELGAMRARVKTRKFQTETYQLYRVFQIEKVLGNDIAAPSHAPASH